MRDLRSWQWLPGTHLLLVLREGFLAVLNAELEVEQLPSMRDQLAWVPMAELQGPSSWRTRVALSASGAQVRHRQLWSWPFTFGNSLLPSIRDQLAWVPMTELQGLSSWRTCVALSAGGAQVRSQGALQLLDWQSEAQRPPSLPL